MDDNFYKKIVDDSQIGYAYYKIICTKDGIPCDYEFKEVNRAFEKLMGLDGKDIIGKLVSDVLPEIRADNFDFIKFFGDIVNNVGDEKHDHFYGPLNRQYKIRAYSPQKNYFITLFEDVSIYKKSLEETVADPEYFEMIFDTNPDAILTISLNNGKIVNANSVFAEKIGYSRYELIGKNCNEANICTNPNHYQMIIIELLEKGSFDNIEIAFKRKDGSIFTALMSGKTIQLFAGLYGFYNIHDIDDRKRAEEALIASEIRYRRLFESAKDGIIILDAETGMINDVNPFLINLLGYTKEQFIDKAIWDIGLFQDKRSNLENFSELQNNEYIRYEDMPLQTADGHMINVEFVSNVYFVNDKKVIQCNIRDITERKIAEKALSESERKYSDYIENAPDGVFVVDGKGRYIDVNKALIQITGYSREELLKMSIKDITAEESSNAAMALFEELVNTGSISGEAQYKHKNSSKRWWSIDAVKLTENRYLSFTRDITDKKKAEADLIIFGYHDYLTGLYNRRFFEEKLKSLDAKTNLPLSIIMCDFNGLKLINDSFGHEFGDKLLKKAAESIKKACRAEDIISRIGGDEFAVLLPNTDAEEAAHIADHIKELASKEKVAHIELSISYGYDTKKNDKQVIMDVLANAENHMYIHKLYERTSMRSKTVDLIMNTLFEKSNRESLHSARVSSICQAIASKMDFEKGYVDKMRVSGLIHDIGKIGIDEKILNKAGSLNSAERKEIERHPEVGWRILSATNEFSELALFVRDHHEKWDGSGYPNGLKGEAIPLEARIITVADAYDAMTSERPYKNACTKDEAINELKRCSGTHFDAEIVDVFVNRVLPCNRNLWGAWDKSFFSVMEKKS